MSNHMVKHVSMQPADLRDGRIRLSEIDHALGSGGKMEAIDSCPTKAR